MKSIRRQMLRYLIIGTIVLFSILFIVTDLKLKDLPKHIRNQYSEIVNARADEVSKELKGFVEQITIVSKSPIIKSMELNKIKSYLPHLVLNQKYRNMTIAYPDGKAWSTLMDDIDISKQEQYQRIFVEKKEYAISQPFRSPYVYESEDPIVIVSHSVIDDNGEIIGLVNGVIKIDFLNKIVKELELKNSGYGWIVNSDGLVVAHPDAKASLEKNIRDYIKDWDHTIEENFNDRQGTVEYLDENGSKMLAFFSNIKESPDWTFIVSISENDIYKEVNDVRNAIWTALLIGLVSVIVFSFHYSKSISKPILELKNTFEKATHGNLNVRANEKVPNELGLAASSFNKMLEQIKHLTYRDLVTKLYNYNGFLLELPYKINKLIQDKDAIAIVIISIDDFKRINSIHGYDIGDEVLSEFAKRLTGFINSNEIVARFLGDEFILLLHGEQILSVEKRIRILWELCSGEIKIRDTEFILKTSIGASIMMDRAISMEEIINQATIAKLIAKKMGGNNYKFYNFELDEVVREEQKIENALYHAVENNELRLVYQPIIDLCTEEIVGTEALLRWNHPEYNKVSPLLMIQIAEQSGIIGEIGEWVLREACRQNKDWQNKGHQPTVISVNVSALQFDQGDFVEIVEEILNDVNMEPRYLELEITETNAMDRVEEKLAKMKKLKDMGVRISIDDFGTGYSSLAYFTRFPIDTLKIDRSFVKDMLSDENSKNIVTTIINMAKSIKIKIIAEGVETLEQLEQLSKMGCDKIQGYLISRPVEPKELEKLFDEKRSY